MAAYETYETDKDYDTMEMQNTQAAEKVIYISIILVGRNMLNLIEVFRMAFLCPFIIFFKTFFKAPVAVPTVIKGRGHGKVQLLKL